MAKTMDIVRAEMEHITFLDLNQDEIPEDGEHCLVFDFGFSEMVWNAALRCFRTDEMNDNTHSITISNGPLWLPLPDPKRLEREEKESLRKALKGEQSSTARY